MTSWRLRFFPTAKYSADLENWHSYHESNENTFFFKVMDVKFCFYGVLFLRLNKDIWKSTQSDAWQQVSCLLTNVVCSLIIFLFLKISHVNKKHQAHEKKPKPKTKTKKQKHTPFSYPTNQGLGVSSDVTVKVHILTLRRADCCTG